MKGRIGIWIEGTEVIGKELERIRTDRAASDLVTHLPSVRVTCSMRPKGLGESAAAAS